MLFKWFIWESVWESLWSDLDLSIEERCFSRPQTFSSTWTIALYFNKAKIHLFWDRNWNLARPVSWHILMTLCPSVSLMGNCTTKQSRKLNSGIIPRNSTASHLLFTCIPSVPSPCKGLQISLGNPSQNLQHILVPDANYSIILKAITQTRKDPEGGLYTVSICDTEGRGITELNSLPGQTRTP